MLSVVTSNESGGIFHPSRRKHNKCCDLKPADMARVLNALAHPARLQIMRLMEERELLLDALVRMMDPLTKTQVYRHVRILEEAGLIGCGRKNFRGYYSVIEQDCASVREVIEAAIESIDTPDQSSRAKKPVLPSES